MAPPETYFAANQSELESCAPGWVLAEANVDSPREVTGINPFLRTEVRSWDYRNPQQPDPPESSSLATIDGLRQFRSPLLTIEFFGQLVFAVAGIEAERVSGQIVGQELLVSGEYDTWIHRIPPELWRPVAEITDARVDSILETWQEPTARIVRTGFAAKIFGKYTGESFEPTQPTLDAKRIALAEIRTLTEYALSSAREVFVLTST